MQKGDENVPRGKCLINKMSVGTPPPPKPWETTTLTNGGSSTKDTPLASGDAIKPWDVPGAGERPSGALRRRSSSSSLSLCCVLLFALCASRVRVNAFDFFPISNCVKSFLRAALPFARRPTLCSSRGVTRRVLLLLIFLVLLCVVFFRRRKTNTNTNSERGDGIEPIRGNEST